MEPIATFLALAAGYILKGAGQSKAADTMKEAWKSDAFCGLML